MKIHTDTIAASKKRADAYSNTLFATDPRFSTAVQIVHEDGSLFFIKDAFEMVDPEDSHFLWVITEHFEEFVFERDEVCVSTWKQESGHGRISFDQQPKLSNNYLRLKEPTATATACECAKYHSGMDLMILCAHDPRCPLSRKSGK